jgi:hypothetical protein
MTTKIWLLPACTALAILVSPAARGETLDELYQKAKAEKEVVFYSGGPAAPHENRAKLFMQQFPGIEVKVTGGFSNVLNEQIEKQMAEKKLAVDMAFFQTVQDFVTWKRQGKLTLFKPDGFDQILPNFRDPDGAYMALSANALTYAYNTAAVKPEDAPKSGAGFPEADVRRQDDQRLSGRRRCRALSVPSHRAEIRLAVDGQVHRQQGELRPRPSAGGAERRLRREHRDARRLVVGMAVQA